MRRARVTLMAAAFAGIALVSASPASSADTAAPAAQYKSYLFMENDGFACKQLVANDSGHASDPLASVSATASVACRRIAGLRVSGLGLTDDYNATIVALGKKARVSIARPTTLFAPMALTYDPDTTWTDRLGWPVRSAALQREGYDKVNTGQPSCIHFISGGMLRLSPYTSHCSAYAAWVADRVFGINLVPTALGDWCHAAAEQRDRMLNDPANWRQVDAVGAQEAANHGSLVLAARKAGDPTKPAHTQNGHIAVVLPMTAPVASSLQDGMTYPSSPAITDTSTFRDFIRLYGPEIAQAGGLNFEHTVTANGFSSYYPAGSTPGVTPVDEVVEFFVYRHETKVDWLLG